MQSPVPEHKEAMTCQRRYIYILAKLYSTMNYSTVSCELDVSKSVIQVKTDAMRQKQTQNKALGQLLDESL